MIEPTLALQTAIRSRLLATPAVLALVPDTHIRAGSTRPDKTPAIIMSDGHTVLDGYNYASQRTAWVYLDLHIWTLDAGEQAAKEIAFAVCNALDTAINLDGAACDHFRVTGSIFPRDPDPAYGHGVLNVEAFVRWTL
jgi:hypothetical protein